MDNQSHEPQSLGPGNAEGPVPSHVEGPAPSNIIRHDGWTGERMATFLETLAETAVVAEACDAASMSVTGAYAARRRNPLFAAAWDAALGIARERLADTLLARSMEGNVEQLYRGGEMVGERHFLDNRLGLQILRRLDRLADAAARAGAKPCSSGAMGPAPVTAQSIDWAFAVEALRTGDDEGVARALALVKSNEVEEVEGAPNPQLRDGDDESLDLSDRCWRDPDDGWMADFPPPPGFTGFESRDYDELDEEEPYMRACTEEEVAILDADTASDRAAQRADEEALRDEWFAMLRSDTPREASPPQR